MQELYLPVDKIRKFNLGKGFLQQYKGKQPNWGYGILSYIVYRRTYSRPMGQENEEWYDTCKRVVEGTFTIMKAHCYKARIPFDVTKAQKMARRMFELMWEFKFLPPGRGLWSMGMPYLYERGGASLNNCGFISTKDISDVNFSDPFCWAMDMSMLGVGVGFDVRGMNNNVKIVQPNVGNHVHVIGDSKEGWVECLHIILMAYVGKGSIPKEWDASGVRSEGSEIETFGGIAPGPRPLLNMIQELTRVLDAKIGSVVDSELITDIMNISGKCVVSGGIRRTAQISIGLPEDDTFRNLKNPNLNMERLNSWGWASNNTIQAYIGMDYTDPAQETAISGDPGYWWKENARNYGRMGDPPNFLDALASGTNPCGEQTLYSGELCNVVESMIARHSTLEEYLETCAYAYLYAKVVTLLPTHRDNTNLIMMTNRRIGLSQTGIQQAIQKMGMSEYLRWCDEAYRFIQEKDKEYSGWLCVPRSIKTTSIKPSGTVSILSGATPGIHFPHAPYYIRRVRCSVHNNMWKTCKSLGFDVEPDKKVPDTMVISFPIKELDPTVRTKNQVSMFEQVAIAAKVQKHWADNQVSATVTFKQEEAKDIARVLDIFQEDLKGISFLPIMDHGFDQPPFEEISEEEYNRMVASTTEDYGAFNIQHDSEDKFCDSEVCLMG